MKAILVSERVLSAALVIVAIGMTVGSSAFACGTHGTNFANDVSSWLQTDASAGMVQGIIHFEDGLVAPTTATTCVTGIGLGSATQPLPLGISVTGADVVITNTANGTRTSLSEFDFISNPITTSALTAGAGSSGPPGTNPLFPGSTWFGFSSPVDAFPQPILETDEIIEFVFKLEIAEGLLPLVLDVQYAAGEGLSDGSPIFSGDHPVQYFSTADPSVHIHRAAVPEPNSFAAALILLSALACTRCRHRSQCPHV